MSVNADMIEYWNADTGAAWVRGQEQMDRFLGGFGERAQALLELRGGERVLDVGCGCGETSLALAQAVGERGSVTGIDVSRPMLARAAERSERAGLSQRISFRQADAQSAELGESAYDAVYSRFGVMFFAGPLEAFANLARAARRGARLGFVCWQSRHGNAWLSEPARAAAAYLELGARAEDDAPGPFGLASEQRTRALLREAGWRDVELHALRDPVRVGDTIDGALAMLTTVGAVGAALRREGLDAQTREKAIAAVRGAIAPYAGPGGVFAPAAAWLVAARR
jgi:SAM-dependent methyltransferase